MCQHLYSSGNSFQILSCQRRISWWRRFFCAIKNQISRSYSVDWIQWHEIKRSCYHDGFSRLFILHPPRRKVCVNLIQQSAKNPACLELGNRIGVNNWGPNRQTTSGFKTVFDSPHKNFGLWGYSNNTCERTWGGEDWSVHKDPHTFRALARGRVR